MNIIATTDVSIRRIIQTGKSEAVTLYMAYLEVSEWQGTRIVKATTDFMAKRLNWTEERVRKSKKVLKDLGLVNDFERRKKGKISGRFIEILFSISQRASLPDFLTEESLAEANGRQVLDNGYKVLDNEKKDISSFSLFWDAYQKKIDRPKCERLWNKLTPEEQKEVMEHIPRYLLTIKDKQFQRHPATYLNNRTWENDLPEVPTPEHPTWRPRDLKLKPDGRPVIDETNIASWSEAKVIQKLGVPRYMELLSQGYQDPYDNFY